MISDLFEDEWCVFDFEFGCGYVGGVVIGGVCCWWRCLVGYGSIRLENCGGFGV